MPSPSGIAVGLFTLPELVALRKELLTNGVITSLSGGAKSGGFARLDPKQQGIELLYAWKLLSGAKGSDKLYVDLSGYK